MDLEALIRKYSTAGPRYTSYPTVPHWTEVSSEQYTKHLQSGFLKPGRTVGLYIHLPFCESLCYYCGCNIQITKDRSRSSSYVDAILVELNRVADLLGARKTLSQISWGGGTPTFLTEPEIERLYLGIANRFDIDSGSDISIEIDPRITSRAQLKLLRSLGFNRVSLGVQDFNPKVQEAVNRIQPADMTAAMLQYCAELGFKDTNFDLIYGLPHQTPDSVASTIEKVLEMKPSRIAIYNYARLPSLLKHQTILEKYPMPSAEERVEIFSAAYKAFLEAGYESIGMDHFALKEDELSKAVNQGTLYRNFMGYVAKRGTDLIGLGTSSIGELGGAYFQNVKGAKDYEAAIAGGGLATLRGHFLSPDDEQRKWIIQRLMCQFFLNYEEFAGQFKLDFKQEFASELASLSSLVEDGIVTLGEKGIGITMLGRLFIRNVAMIFDAYQKKPAGVTFSKTV